MRLGWGRQRLEEGADFSRPNPTMREREGEKWVAPTIVEVGSGEGHQG